MITDRKQAKADLRRSYNVYLQLGLIVALLSFIGLVRINLYSEPPSPPPVEEQEEVVMEEVIQTKQIETPPPPPRPPVPVEVPNDEIIEDEILDLDTELDLGDMFELPPPPPPRDDEPEDDFFVVVEQMPQLRGGLGALQRKVSYPEMARRAGIEGRVTVQFIVNEQGRVENPRVIRGIGGGCDEEAIRVVQSAKFTPGYQRGRPVRVKYTLPIVFQLQD